jgi:hypothetical protein
MRDITIELETLSLCRAPLPSPLGCFGREAFVLVGFGQESRDLAGLPVVSELDEGGARIGAGRAFSGEGMLAFDSHADFHRTRECGVETRGQPNDVADFDRCLELERIDPRGAVPIVLVCWGMTISVISVNDSEGAFASIG